MGLLLILPLLALDGWVLFSTVRRLRRIAAPPAWWRRFFVSVTLGLALGLWFTCFLEYHLGAQRRVAGFPVPLGFFSLDDAIWTHHPLPQPLLALAWITDWLCGVTFAVLPLATAALLREFKLETPPRDEAAAP